MAIYHFSGQIISRSTGRNAVASAAYRSAEKLHDQRTDRSYDFQKKSPDILHKEILLPKNVPECFHDRETLWNTVEQNEKRKDAQLAREFNIALPRELTTEQNVELITEFVKRDFVEKGMIADVCVHRGHHHGEDQPHAHVMLTLREVTADGFGQKVRDWNQRGFINHWRESWADHCNHYLALHQIETRIDHRTLKEQGIELEPQRKIGAKPVQSRFLRLEEHQTIAQENGERLLEKPEIALKALTQQHSTFTHQDIARFVNRHSNSADQFQLIYEKIKNHESLVKLGHDKLGRERFSTKEMVTLESQMLDRAIIKSEQSKFSISVTDTQHLLQCYHLSDIQKTAFNHLTSERDLSCVIGVAGSGKSYLLGATREAWKSQGYRVQGMTLSGIAAENLEASSDIKSYTVANRLWHWQHGREQLTSRDVVVIDEAGMLGSRQLGAILEETHRATAKVVLVFDPEQLQAIEAGAASRAIAERVGYVELTEVRRQREGWQQQATLDCSKGNTQRALQAYQERGFIREHATQQDAIGDIVKHWRESQTKDNQATQIVLAYTKNEVKLLNQAIRHNKHEHHELGQDHSLMTEQGERHFAVGDQIYFLRGEKSLGVKNGTLGTIEIISGQQLTVKLQNTQGVKEKNESSRRVMFDLGNYRHIDHGYAATIHKAQGVTVDRTQVLASPYFDRHTTYVALSRHREQIKLHYSREVFAHDYQLTKTLCRVRIKDTTQDYPLDRHIDKETQWADLLSRAKTHKQQNEAKKQYALDQKESLLDFKRRYERSHRLKADLLQRRIPTVGIAKDKQLAIDMEDRCVSLERAIKKSPFAWQEQKKLYECAKTLHQRSDVMAELKARNPELAKRVMEFGKSYERSLDRGISR